MKFLYKVTQNIYDVHTLRYYSIKYVCMFSHTWNVALSLIWINSIFNLIITVKHIINITN